uniref:Uncharacterized protein n=1 Tax=Brassica oleracea TaxID=3712 RepID=A0A3P6F3M0_BRAOL|nr:unnamed protein product [Brassica oleracea]
MSIICISKKLWFLLWSLRWRRRLTIIPNHKGMLPCVSSTRKKNRR